MITLALNVTLVLQGSRDIEGSFNQPSTSGEDCKENKMKLIHELGYLLAGYNEALY